MIERPYFVANDTAGSKKDTAVLLVGTAREFGIHQRAIAMVRGGFHITEELAAVLYDESDDEPDTETSGNRAEKNNTNPKGK